MVPSIGYEMNERYKNSERADQTAGVKTNEAARSDRFAHRGALPPQRLGAGSLRITVGPEPAVARIVLNQESCPCAHGGGKTSEHKIGVAPSQQFDQLRGQRRHQQRSDSDTAHGQTGSKAATADKPTLYRANGRHIGAADAEPNTKSVSGVYLQQVAGGACGCQPKSGQNHAGNGETACTKTIGEGAADDPKAEVKESGQREHQRHRSARGAEFPLQRFDKGAERISAAEADESYRECGQDDEPAIKKSWISRCSVIAHRSPPSERSSSDTIISVILVFVAVNR